MFEVTGESVLTLYESHVAGAPASTLLVVTEKPLSADALAALEKSAASLGFGEAPLAVAVVETPTIVEGLDPVAAVAADAFAAELVSTAYRLPVALNDKNRVLGRTVVVFEDFEALMKTPADKQRAWALLKKLV